MYTMYIYIYIYIHTYIHIPLSLSLYIYIYTYRHLAPTVQRIGIARDRKRGKTVGGRSVSFDKQHSQFTLQNKHLLHSHTYIYTHMYIYIYT